MGTLAPLEPTLASLVAPLTAAEFFERHWEKKLFHAAGSADRLAALAETLDDFDVERAFRNAGYAPLITMADPDGGPPIRLTDNTEMALTMYRLGAMISVGKTPQLIPWAARLATELGVPFTELTYDLHANRKGAGRPLALGGSERFVVQLRGVERWSAAEAGIRFPVGDLVHGDTLTSDMLQQLGGSAAPPAAMNDPIDLTPGSVLYLPRGTWARSTALESSLSVVVNYAPVPYLDVVLAALRSRLLEIEDWRRAPQGMHGSGEARARALGRLEDLLRTLPEIAAGLGAAEIAPPDRDATPRVARSAADVFGDRLPAALVRQPLAAATLGGRYRVDVKDAGTWLVDLDAKPARIEKDGAGEVEITIEISASDFASLYRDPEVEARRLYTEKKLRLWGPNGGKRATDLVRLFLLAD